ncbi:hypothetical protein V6N12_053050 [Hibiscus sabdariffa]|uniref:Formyl transferase N-terminal domain-containing protein n=1 Tax=Hibiscus sabdariffa TaxID=183260 RepID=A0ABR2AYH6_9ROSI
MRIKYNLGSIPHFGTVNIHPSLLPLYRGAAPVQRTLQDGVKETGVSLAFTVRALDAGPVIAREKVEVDDQIKVLEVQLPGKKVTSEAAFWNGLRGQKLKTL